MSIKNVDENIHLGNEYQNVNYFLGKELEDFADIAVYISKMYAACMCLFEAGRLEVIAFKGINTEALDRLAEFCNHAIDPSKESELSDPEIAGFLLPSFSSTDRNLGSFISIPLVDVEGVLLGTFCLLDPARKTIDKEQKNMLDMLVRQVAQKISTEKKARASTTIEAQIFQNAILESERFFVMTTDTNGIIQFYNKGAEGILGYAAEEIVDSASLNLFIGEEDIKARAEALSKEFNCEVKADAFSVAVERAKRGLIDESEWIVRKKTGERIIVSVVGIALKDHKGGLVGFLGIGTDVTEQKKIERELVHSRNYFKSVINAIPHPMLVKDRQHQFVMLNDAWIAMMQTTREEVEGKNAEEIFPAEYATLLYEKDEACFNAQEKSFTDEVDFTIDKGEGKVENFAALCYRKIFENDFGEEYLALSVIDITERKEAENKLAKSEQRFRALVENSSDFITILEPDGIFRYESPSFYRVTTFKEDDIIGQNCAKFIHPDDKSRAITNFLNAVENPESKYVDEFRHMKGNGEWMTLEIVGKNRLNDEAVKGMVINSRDITERKRAEMEVQRSEQKLRALIENSTDFIVVLESDGRIRYASPSLLKASGFAEQELIGKFCSEFIHENDQDRVVKTFLGAIHEPGAQYSDVFRYQKFDGEWMTVEVVGKNALTDEAVKGVVLNLRDITERKRAEAELAQSEQRFSAFIQNSSDIITILEADGTFRYESPSFYKFSGYTEDEIIGKNCLDYIHPDYIENSVRIFREAREQPGSTYKDEFPFRKADGSWAMIEISGKNALDDEIVKGVVINCRDVTERKQIEKEIRIKSRMLQGITENMPVVIFRVDEAGIFTESIGAGLKKIGLEENEVVGKNIFELYPEMAGKIQSAYRGEPATAILESKDETNPWFFEFYAFPDNNAGGLIGFGLDISDKKNHEETQKRYAATLEKVNKELDQFAYVVSHDLKAPLRAINNLSEWIEEDLGEALNGNDDVKNNMMLLRKRVSRMEALINGILEYSRAGRSEIIYECVDVNELVDDVCGSIEIPEAFTLVKPALPVITANKLRLEQVFSNLLSNAVKYHDKPAGKITIAYELKNGFHEFAVVDDGPGIEAQFHEKIFIIFQTLVSKDKKESTGVGLAIVRKIIEEQGGNIWLSSAPEQGSKFIFTLPVKKIINV